MLKLKLSALIAVVLTMRASLADCQQNDEPDFMNVPLPLAVERLIDDHATAFSIGEDKNLGLVTATYDNISKLRVAISRESGGTLIFKPKLELTKPPRLLVADLDGDGKVEVLVSSDKLRIYQVREDGVSLVWTCPEVYEGTLPPNLGLFDLDGDGHLDIVVLDYLPEKMTEAKSLYVYLSRGESFQFSLTGTVTLTDAQDYHSTSALAIGDFFGDERPEIAVGNSNGYLWLLKVEQGKPQILHQWSVPSGGAIGWGLCAGHVVAGAKQQLLVGTNGGDLYVYGVSAEGIPEVIAQGSSGRLAYHVFAADMDGDGLDEFLLTRGCLGYANMTQKDVVTEIRNVFGGEITTIWSKEATGFTYPRLMLHDFDRDGRPEFITYSLIGKGKSIEAFKPLLGR